jgi:hypothetical protein
MKYLYKYPQAAFPYDDLVATNRARSRYEPEYELLDTGIFDDNRYFDVFVEYAKASPHDVLIKISVANRGPEAATLQLLPTLWFRNTWNSSENGTKPLLQQLTAGGYSVVHAQLGPVDESQDCSDYFFYSEPGGQLLFTENETNHERLFDTPNTSPFVKDGINNYIVHGAKDAVNPNGKGTKVSPHYDLTVQAEATTVLRFRLTTTATDQISDPFGQLFEQTFASRIQEAEHFFATVIPPSVLADSDRTNVMRQALAGMMWTKQFFHYELDQWLRERNVNPWSAPVERLHVRNS